MNPTKPLYTARVDPRDRLVPAPAAVISFMQPLFTSIHGPFKFYVTALGSSYVVGPESVYQVWEANGKSVAAHFSLSHIGGATTFLFSAVSLAPGVEVSIISGSCPSS
jgi:hypothetical protein